jgi:hypothetical protein
MISKHEVSRSQKPSIKISLGIISPIFFGEKGSTEEGSFNFSE